MKKTFAILLSVVLIMACCMPVFAAEIPVQNDTVVSKITYTEIEDLNTLSTLAKNNINNYAIKTEDCTAKITFDDGCTFPVNAKRITQLLSNTQFRNGNTEKEYVSTIVVDLADIVEPEIQTKGSHTHEESSGVLHDMVKAYAKNYYTTGTVSDGGVSNVAWVRYDYASARFTNGDGASVLSNRKMDVMYAGKKLVQDGGSWVNHTASWNISSDSETKKSIPIQERYEELYYTFKNTVSCTVTRYGNYTLNLSVECLTSNFG